MRLGGFVDGTIYFGYTNFTADNAPVWVASQVLALSPGTHYWMASIQGVAGQTQQATFTIRSAAK
jgi:hypothetical protein